MVVHPARSFRGHAGRLFYTTVHRLKAWGVNVVRASSTGDKETSGLIIVAKNDRAHRHLQEQFKARTVFKEYLALVEGHVEPAQARIVAPLGATLPIGAVKAILPPEKVGLTPSIVSWVRTTALPSTIATPRQTSPWSASSCTPGAPTKFAYTLPGASIRWSATRCMAITNPACHWTVNFSMRTAYAFGYRAPAKKKNSCAPLPAELQSLVDTHLR